MSSIKITDLPEGRYRDVLVEADKRASEILKSIPHKHPWETLTLVAVGLADIIAEMREKEEKNAKEWSDFTTRMQRIRPDPNCDVLGRPLHG